MIINGLPASGFSAFGFPGFRKCGGSRKVGGTGSSFFRIDFRKILIALCLTRMAWEKRTQNIEFKLVAGKIFRNKDLADALTRLRRHAAGARRLGDSRGGADATAGCLAFAVYRRMNPFFGFSICTVKVVRHKGWNFAVENNC